MRPSLLAPSVVLALSCPDAVFAQSAADLPRAAHPPMVQAPGQLPRNVRPSHYDIEVVPHADKLALDGKVRINIEVLEPTREIVLNAVEMSFANARIGRANGKEVAAKARVDAEAHASAGMPARMTRHRSSCCAPTSSAPCLAWKTRP